MILFREEHHEDKNSAPIQDFEDHGLPIVLSRCDIDIIDITKVKGLAQNQYSSRGTGSPVRSKCKNSA
jgi:hypothetical protein